MDRTFRSEAVSDVIDWEDEEDDGYCEYCDNPNPEFELLVSGPIDTIYLFCDRACAEEYQAVRG